MNIPSNRRFEITNTTIVDEYLGTDALIRHINETRRPSGKQTNSTQTTNHQLHIKGSMSPYGQDKHIKSLGCSHIHGQDMKGKLYTENDPKR